MGPDRLQRLIYVGLWRRQGRLIVKDFTRIKPVSGQPANLSLRALLQFICFNHYSAGILTSKVDPRTVRLKVFLMAVDP